MSTTAEQPSFRIDQPAITCLGLKCICCSTIFPELDSLFCHILRCSVVPVLSALPPTTDHPPEVRETTSCEEETSKQVKRQTKKEFDKQINKTEERHSCLCGLSYSNTHNLIRHQRHGRCAAKKSRKDVQSSIKRHPKERGEERVSRKTDGFRNRCECGLLYSNYHNMLRHQKSGRCSARDEAKQPLLGTNSEQMAGGDAVPQDTDCSAAFDYQLEVEVWSRILTES